MPGETHVRLEAVSKRYGSVTALHAIDLVVAQGELLTLLGPSGCGKTTLLRLIAGFIEPSGGRILIDQAAVTHLPPNRRSIGMVFQSYALFPHLTVARNIGFGLEEHGVPAARIRARVAELLALIRLPDIGERYPAQLSGGQQQRVALARAVAYAPRVLLMDEPLGALDLKLREAMQTEIRQIQKALGTTTVYVTHDQSEAMRMSDRIAVMNQGRIEQCATAADIYAAPQTRFVADFIGKMNFIAARVLAATRDEVTVRSEAGVHCMPAGDGIVVGDEVAIGVRPDDIRLAPAGAHWERFMRVHGCVESKAFLGTFDEVRVRIGPTLTLQIEARPGEIRAGPGDTVEIGWSLDRCRLFRQQA